MLLKVVGIFHILFFYSVCAASLGWVVDDDGCRTPDLGRGRCILARNCKNMVAFLKTIPSPAPPQIKDKLKEYICGHTQGRVKICCPDEPVSLLPRPEMLTADGPAKVESVENHKNINLLPKDCGYMEIPDKISNGQDAGLREFPWMALLKYDNANDAFQCGGTVINEKYILTAAHCITQLQIPPIGVRVGEYDLSNEVDCEKDEDNDTKKCIKAPVQDLQIEELIPHPNFTKKYNSEDGFNDIGLIRVKGLKMAENVHPICLPVGEARNAELNKVIITGWGFTKKESISLSNILQKVTLSAIPWNECQKEYPTIRVSHKQLCAKKKMKDSCNGDSGGPLQTPKSINGEISMVQYGVVSFGGRLCGESTYPGIYTNVETYMKWILDNMKP